MHPSLFFHPGALLSQAELSAARIDGVLIEVGECYMPPDLPEDAGARATSLKPILVPGFCLCGPSAAWVHGAGDGPPWRHHLQRIVAHRSRVRTPPAVVLHERSIEPAEVRTIAGIPVTTRLRTLTDLVLGASDDAESDEWMRRFGAAEPELVGQVRDLIAAKGRMPGKRDAIARLDGLSG